MLTVLQLSRHFDRGTGIATVATSLERAFVQTGCRVERFDLSSTRCPVRAARIGNPLARRVAFLVEALWFGVAATRHVRRTRADRPAVVTVAHGDALAADVFVNHGLISADLAREHGIPKLVGALAYLPLTRRERRRLRSSEIGTFVHVGGADADFVTSLHPATRLRFASLAVGVDTDRFRPPSPAQRQAARGESGLSDDDHAVAFVGHEFRRKGLYPLLDAIARLPGTVRLFVAGGDDAQISAARRAAAPWARPGRVTFLGPASDVRRLYWAADVLCLPSRYETGPLVLLEALATGLPVVMTPVGLAPTLLADGRTGRLTDDSSRQLATALASVLHLSPDDRRAAAQAARATAEEFSWGRVARDCLALMPEAVGRRGVDIHAAMPPADGRAAGPPRQRNSEPPGPG